MRLPFWGNTAFSKSSSRVVFRLRNVKLTFNGWRILEQVFRGSLFGKKFSPSGLRELKGFKIHIRSEMFESFEIEQPNSAHKLVTILNQNSDEQQRRFDLTNTTSLKNLKEPFTRFDCEIVADHQRWPFGSNERALFKRFELWWSCFVNYPIAPMTSWKSKIRSIGNTSQGSGESSQSLASTQQSLGSHKLLKTCQQNRPTH